MSKTKLPPKALCTDGVFCHKGYLMGSPPYTHRESLRRLVSLKVSIFFSRALLCIFAIFQNVLISLQNGNWRHTIIPSIDASIRVSLTLLSELAPKQMCISIFCTVPNLFYKPGGKGGGKIHCVDYLLLFINLFRMFGESLLSADLKNKKTRAHQQLICIC